MTDLWRCSCFREFQLKRRLTRGVSSVSAPIRFPNREDVWNHTVSEPSRTVFNILNPRHCGILLGYTSTKALCEAPNAVGSLLHRPFIHERVLKHLVCDTAYHCVQHFSKSWVESVSESAGRTYKISRPKWRTFSATTKFSTTEHPQGWHFPNNHAGAAHLYQGCAFND